MKNIVVSGATSFIGRQLLDLLLHDGKNNIVAIIRPNSLNKNKLPNHKNLTVLELPLQEIESILRQISFPIDIFYHFSWEGTRAAARNDKLLQDNNFKFSIKAINAACNLGCKCFVGIGSQAEYGTCIGKITEEYPAFPSTEYGKAKLRTYEEGETITNNFGVRFVWTRIFSVYGINDNPKTLVMSALDKMLNNEPVLLTTCEQLWDYVYVKDAANALYLLGINEKCQGVYNIASGETRKLKSFVEEMKSISQSQSKLYFGAIPYEGATSFEPSVKKLESHTGWLAKISFREGIKEILNSKQGIK